MKIVGYNENGYIATVSNEEIGTFTKVPRRGKKLSNSDKVAIGTELKFPTTEEQTYLLTSLRDALISKVREVEVLIAQVSEAGEGKLIPPAIAKPIKEDMD